LADEDHEKAPAPETRELETGGGATSNAFR
jgi:hypothetical protein